MDPAASAAMTTTERSEMRKTPLKSARRRASWTAWTSLRLAHPAHTAEQDQKKRTNHALPKPDKFIRYRQQKFGDGQAPEASVQVQTAQRTIASADLAAGDPRRWLALPILLIGA